jgi:6-pyruvoyltetrahydropterin/6-carboxytetrahydropterin synthase
MFEIEVEAEFAAAHGLVIKGQHEPLHGHNWRVTVTLEGRELDDDGLLCDFHVVERALERVIGCWHNSNLNDIEPFAGGLGRKEGLNPSAENVAHSIAALLSADLEGRLARAVITRVRVTEAPGCAASYYPGGRARATP